jgi:transcription termination/antitermination protein NusG
MLAPQSSQSERWYMARCQRGSDGQVIEGFRTAGIETYYPKFLEMARVPRRELTASQRNCGHSIERPMARPLFPRYVMILADLRRFDWQTLFRRIGAAGFTCEGNLPVAVRPAELSRIRERENGGMIDGKEKTRVVFGLGEQVTITSGPFASFPATVEKALDLPISALDPATRIAVAISIFGRMTRADLELWQVAKH